MTAPTEPNIILPSSPADLKKIKDALNQAVLCEVRMDAERAAKKDIIQMIHDEYELPKRIVSRMVKTMHKHNFSEVASEMDDFVAAYEKIAGA